MESAPLEAAQAQLRKASSFATRADYTRVSALHSEAAREFATAGASTQDSEAARVLTLLEQHHARLARIVKSQGAVSSSKTLQGSAEATTSAIAATTGGVQQKPPSHYKSLSPRSAKTFQPSAKDPTSSLATNLASARGIPSKSVVGDHTGRPNSKPGRSALDPAPTSAGRGYAAGQPSNEVSRSSQQYGTNSGSTQSSNGDLEADDPSNLSDEPPSVIQDAYARFQSSFGYLFSSLSSPLAFAGLPLNPDATTVTATAGPDPMQTKRKKSSRPAQAVETPSLKSARGGPLDVASLFSPAALKAAQTPDPPAAHLAESFYVIPSDLSGRLVTPLGTSVMLSSATLHSYSTAHLPPAGSTFSPSSVKRPPSRGASTGPMRAGTSSSNKSPEELQLENAALRAQVDHFSSRLQAFQSASQSAGMALHQSLRSLRAPTSPERSSGRPGSSQRPEGKSTIPASGEQGGGRRGEEEAEAEAEELKRLKAELLRLGGDNAKLKRSADRYREKYRAGQKEREREREREKEGGQKEGRRRERESAGTGTGVAAGAGGAGVIVSVGSGGGAAGTAAGGRQTG